MLYSRFKVIQFAKKDCFRSVSEQLVPHTINGNLL